MQAVNCAPIGQRQGEKRRGDCCQAVTGTVSDLAGLSARSHRHRNHPAARRDPVAEGRDRNDGAYGGNKLGRAPTANAISHCSACP
jgi:hypothetical protein